MYSKTEWTDKVTQKLNVYTMTDNGDGTVTLTQEPGEVFSDGTPINAQNLNKIENELELLDGRHGMLYINGEIWPVVVGDTPQEGVITISTAGFGMVYVGLSMLRRFMVGLTSIRQIYYNLTKVWQQGFEVLYDYGLVDGVQWSANRLPHANYYNTSLCSADMTHIDDEDGYMQLIVGNLTGSTLRYNSHVCGAQAYTLPYTATKLKVTIIRGPNSCYLRFGLLTEDCVNSQDATNGGVMSSLITMTSGERTYELELPEGLAGHPYIPVINIVREPSGFHQSMIKKVWYE